MVIWNKIMDQTTHNSIALNTHSVEDYLDSCSYLVMVSWTHSADVKNSKLLRWQ